MMWQLLKGIFLGLYVGRKAKKNHELREVPLPFKWLTAIILTLALIGIASLVR